MRAFGVAAGFVLLMLLLYGAWYFSEPQQTKRAIDRQRREREAIEEKERSAGLYFYDHYGEKRIDDGGDY